MESLYRTPPIGPEDFKDFVTVIESKLQPSPIRLERHLRQAEGDLLLESRLETMLDCCFEYTKDVASHERLRRMGRDAQTETEEADIKRSAMHGATVTAIIAYTDALEDRGFSNPDEPEVIPHKNQSRAYFGKFAILLTLNRFKEQIQLISRVKEQGHDADYEKLKKISRNESELMTIEYVEILSKILEEEEISSESLADKEMALHDIEDRLHKNESEILQEFLSIYERGYKIVG